MVACQPLQSDPGRTCGVTFAGLRALVASLGLMIVVYGGVYAWLLWST
jgi:hypothetical protein